jgi:FKBP-type peptidyl-prolyl cis-trans isomerase
MSKKSALARRRAEQEAKRRKRARLITVGIAAAALVAVVATVVLITYFAIRVEPYPAGLDVEVLAKGTGKKAQIGDLVTVDYTGWLEDGTVFDSSVDKGQPFQFTLGEGGVIKGWDEAVRRMSVGDKHRLTIAPDLAYGETGRGTIPPDATLIFEVEVLAVE